MWWPRYLARVERVEEALTRLRKRMQAPPPEPSVIAFSEPPAGDDIRLFPIVGRDLCFPVAALLARDKLEEAGRLVPEHSWVASVPLYG